MPFVQVNDVKLHYEMEGSGPPLLMVAGTGLPGAEFKTVDGSAHMRFWQKPAETCSTIMEFLRRH